MEDDYVDLNWLENEIKTNKNIFNISKFESVEITPAVNPGENYASRLLNLKIKARRKDGSKKTISIILKRNLDLKLFDKSSNSESLKNVLGEAYFREYFFYTSIFPMLEKYLDNNEKLSPVCLASIESKDLYLEDLKESGYEVGNRMTGLDEDHCHIVFQSLAKFHAATYLAISQDLINVKSFNKYAMIDGTTGDGNKKSNVYEFIADVISKDWDPKWRPIADKLIKIKLKIKDCVRETGALNTNSINVINHGDTWVNNMMFKYTKYKKPKSVKFVDFQMPHYNSLVYDISYFLNTSVDCETKQTHFESFLETYCNSFKQVLDKNNSDLPCPTPDQVKRELIRVTPFSLTITCRVRPVIMCPPENSIPLSELVKDNGLTKEKRKIYGNSALAKVLQLELPTLLDELDPLLFE